MAQQGLTQVLGAVRTSPTMVTNVVRPIASTPEEGAVTGNSLPQDKKAALLIGGGGPQQLPIAAGGGYLSSSSSPGPVSVTPVGGSGLVTSLVLGGSFPATHNHTSGVTSTITPPAGPKPLAQVQYILPTEGPSSPQLTHQQILSLPANAALANGIHSGAGIRVASVSPGTRGETESSGWLIKKEQISLVSVFSPVSTETWKRVFLKFFSFCCKSLIFY